MDEVKDEKYLRRRKRAKKRKRKRQMVSVGTLILLIFLIVSCTNRKIHNAKLSKVELSEDMIWYIGKSQGIRTKKKMFDKKQDSIIPLLKIDSLKDHYLVKNSNHLKIASSYAYDAKKINSYIENNSYKGNDKIVFLTFDDGPNTQVTPKILDILKKNNVHGTFFLVGKSINESHAGVIHQILNDGNAIANHSFSHDYKTLYPGRVCDPQIIKKEVELTNQRLQEILGKDFKAKVFRYPGGHMSWENTDQADLALSSLDVQWIDWNTLVGDAEKRSQRPTTIEGQVEYVKKNLDKNKNTKIAVVLAHDSKGKELTVEALPKVIDYFKSNGYKFGVLK